MTTPAARRTITVHGVHCENETPRALLCSADMGNGSLVWVPKSAIDAASPVKGKYDTGDLIVSYEFAEKEGWL